HAVARHAIAQRDIAGVVGGNTAHPAIATVAGVVLLLLRGSRVNAPAGDIELSPLHTGRAGHAAAESMRYPERFRAAQLAILHHVHHAFAQRIERYGDARLRHDVAARHAITGLRDVRRAGKSGAAPIRCYLELADFERERGL